MFFKMLKKDLMSKIWLNIIIFFFICAASVLLVTSVLHIYISTSGTEKAQECTAMSDGSVIVYSDMSYRDKIVGDVCNKLENDPDVSDFSHNDIITIGEKNIDFNNYDEENDEYLKQAILFLSKQPKKINMIYNDENKPFYVENGCAAISLNFKTMLNAKIGDKVKLTTQMGYTYEFTISQFYKTCRYGYMDMIVLSDSDYEFISEQSPVKYDLFDIKTNSIDKITDMMMSLIDDTDHAVTIQCNNHSGYSGASDARTAITSFMIIVCLFLIFIIFLSIRFTLISAIREEKKEIGMMRALGINSLGFRMIFASKYIAFAVVGGIVGIVAGIPFSNKLSVKFAPNIILNDKFRLVMIGVLIIAIFIVIMILYVLLVLRSINKISVIDVIHGDCKGERFRKSQKLFLHRQRKMPLPLYLALSDLLNGFKRYILLVLVYSTGIMIILFGVHLKNTITSQHFLRYYMFIENDFQINLGDKSWNRYFDQCGSLWGIADRINSELKEAGIPAHIQYDYTCSAKLILPAGFEKNGVCFFGNYDNKKIKYRKGGTAPLLENEIALSSFSAHTYGLSVGDRVSVKVSEYMDDTISTHEVTREYVITGIFDYMEFSNIGILFGNEYDKAEKMSIQPFECTVDVPENMKGKYVEKIKQMYGEKAVYTRDEFIQRNLSYLIPVINVLKVTVFIMAIAVMIMITIMHYSVLSNEDISFIAMLKSMGIGNSFVRKWQLIRTLFLLVISSVLGNLLMYTLGNVIASKVFETYGLSGFRFLIEPLESYIVIPGVVFAIVLIVMRIVLKNIKGINICDMSND